MTTESALAPAEDSGNSTGYEANTENADGKNPQVFISIFTSKFYCQMLNNTCKI